MPTLQPFKIWSFTCMEPWHHNLFYTYTNKIQPLGWFCNLPHTCPFTSSRGELLKILLLMLFHICKQIIIYTVKWEAAVHTSNSWWGQRMGHWQDHQVNKWNLLTKPQSAVRSPVYIAIVIKNCTQVHYFNRCCTSMFLTTKTLKLKNRLYKETVAILPWCFSSICTNLSQQHLQHVSKYKTCSQQGTTSSWFSPVWSPVKVRVRALSARLEAHFITWHQKNSTFPNILQKTLFNDFIWTSKKHKPSTHQGRHIHETQRRVCVIVPVLQRLAANMKHREIQK